MVSKDLTFIDLGNKSKIEGLVNFEKLRMITKEIRGLMNMCSANLDIFTIIESRTKEDVASSFASLNHPKNAGQTMKRAPADRRKTRDINPRKMHEEAQMVRRVKAYLSQRTVIQNEEELMKLSYKCEPDPSMQNSGSKTLTNHQSTTSITSTVSIFDFLYSRKNLVKTMKSVNKIHDTIWQKILRKKYWKIVFRRYKLTYYLGFFSRVPTAGVFLPFLRFLPSSSESSWKTSALLKNSQNKENVKTKSQGEKPCKARDDL